MSNVIISSYSKAYRNLRAVMPNGATESLELFQECLFIDPISDDMEFEDEDDKQDCQDEYDEGLERQKELNLSPMQLEAVKAISHGMFSITIAEDGTLKMELTE